MNIYFCNINRINEEVEDFVIAKNKIEKPLIVEEKLEKKMTIQEFIDFVNLTEKIFMVNDNNNTSIPFNIYKPTKNEIVVIYSYNDKDDNKIKIFKQNLENKNFDLESLTPLSHIDILQGKVGNESYYIIKNQFFI